MELAQELGMTRDAIAMKCRQLYIRFLDISIGKEQHVWMRKIGRRCRQLNLSAL